MDVRFIQGDTRAAMAALPAESIQCCVTSPPYYGLRDYGTASWQGGKPGCDHLRKASSVSSSSTLRRDGRDHLGPYQGEKATRIGTPYQGDCGKCGAVRVDNQIGLEPTADAYVAEMVEVFRGVRRVLRPDGVLWLNLGDSYAGGGGFCPGAPSTATSRTGQRGAAGALKTGGIKPQGTIKPKDLIGIPWRVAFALQADGWWLRSAVVWHKPNPMPEQVKDRPTSAYEHVFLLSKSPRYFYDADAIAEPAVSDHGSGNGFKRPERLKAANGSDVPWSGVGGTRNARNVWTITPKPFKGAHFATMPLELAERCILAGSRVGDTILDPFGGAGTTGLAALRHGRRATLIELNPAYITIAENRLREAMAQPMKRAA